MKEFIPVLVVVLTTLAGLMTYVFQKRTDRRNELVKMRQEEYRKFIDAFQTTVNENTEKSLGEYHKSMLKLFVVASDRVITAVGNLNAYMADTSRNRGERNMPEVGQRWAVAIK